MISLLNLLLRLSLAGGVTCLVCLAVSALLRNKLPKAWHYGLWLLVTVSFLVPVPLTIRLPAQQLRLPDMSAAAAPVVSDKIHETDLSGSAVSAQTAVNSPLAAEQQARAASPVPARTHIDVALVMMAAWITGAGGMLLWNIAGYCLTAGRLKKGRALVSPGRIPVYENASITTPLLVGLVHPVIYLPKNFHNPELAVRHELCHWRRGDIWSKWFVQLVVCIHWFNPMAHLMKRELNRLSELACDEAIIRDMDAAERQAYGQMLVDTLRVSSNFGGLMIAVLGNKKKWLRERLVGIMDTRSTMKKSAAAMAALVVCVLGTVVLAGGLATGCSAAKTVNQAKTGTSSVVSPDAIAATSSLSPAQSNISYKDGSSPTTSPSTDAVPEKIYVLDENGNVVQKDASEKRFTTCCSVTTIFEDSEISKIAGLKVDFPASFGNGYKLKYRSLGAGTRKEVDYTTSNSPDLNSAVNKAIMDDEAFDKLSGYDPYRFCSATYINERGIQIFLTIEKDRVPLVSRPDSVSVDIGSIYGIWNTNLFPIYHMKVVDGKIRFDMTQPPYQVETKHNLTWTANGFSYYMCYDDNQFKPLSQEEAVEFAKAFMTAQGNETTAQN